jgi:hypothetical protein
VSGQLLWAWDLGRADVLTAPEPAQTYTRGTSNAWSVFSADDALGLVYIPTGNATPDYYGGHRSPESEKYACSVVALDAKTGAMRWSFQTTHHDVWDYDVPSQTGARRPEGQGREPDACPRRTDQARRVVPAGSTYRRTARAGRRACRAANGRTRGMDLEDATVLGWYAVVRR